VPPTEAIGGVAAELVVPHPPGIPVLTPGEVIAAGKVKYLRTILAHGIHLRGPADPRLSTLRVVDRAKAGRQLDTEASNWHILVPDDWEARSPPARTAFTRRPDA
jgi:arginine/lysine/ornithine decarboxylase